MARLTGHFAFNAVEVALHLKGNLALTFIGLAPLGIAKQGADELKLLGQPFPDCRVDQIDIPGDRLGFDAGDAAA